MTEKFFLVLAPALFLCLLLLPSIAHAQRLQPASSPLAIGARRGTADVEKTSIAGVPVAIWKPSGASSQAPYPLVIFSHGFHGSSTQTTFLMNALADDGYLVIAPNHKDAMSAGAVFQKPEVPFARAAKWDDTIFKYRHDDIVQLIDGLKKDAKWNSLIDWSKLSLCGHSLGGYTVLGLAGAWPSWKLNGVKAVVALSPYCQPFVEKGNLAGLGVPIMYQGGTRDFGITPTVKRDGGAFDKTSSPTELVEFGEMGHFGWTGLNRNSSQVDLINHYVLSFLDKYVKGSTDAKPEEKLEGVVLLQVK